MADEKKGTASGWTKRDELAAMFMQGMLAGNATLEAGSSTGSLQNQGAAQQIERATDGILVCSCCSCQTKDSCGDECRRRPRKNGKDKRDNKDCGMNQ